MTKTCEIKNPVVILGAARSGTSMLRNLIASHPDSSQIPYDINFVWKYGNYSVPHDELTPDLANEKILSYIRTYLKRFQGSKQFIVEKTVCNTLRVGFVQEVLPEARYIHIIRDGRDVAVSARKMWRSGLDYGRVIRKAWHIPASAIPSYGSSYLKAYVSRKLSRSKHLPAWGPHFRDLEKALQQFSLIEVCGIQWRESLVHTLESLAHISDSKFYTVKYEELVVDPKRKCSGIFDFLGLKMSPKTEEYLSRIQKASVGKWQKEMSETELRLLQNHVKETLESVGY